MQLLTNSLLKFSSTAFHSLALSWICSYSVAVPSWTHLPPSNLWQSVSFLSHAFHSVGMTLTSCVYSPDFSLTVSHFADFRPASPAGGIPSTPNLVCPKLKHLGSQMSVGSAIIFTQSSCFMVSRPICMSHEMIILY